MNTPTSEGGRRSAPRAEFNMGEGPPTPRGRWSGPRPRVGGKIVVGGAPVGGPPVRSIGGVITAASRPGGSRRACARRPLDRGLAGGMSGRSPTRRARDDTRRHVLGRAMREADLLPFLSGPPSEPIPVDARKPCETCSTALSPKGLGSGTERLSNSGTVRICMLGVTRSRRSILLAESTLGPDARARDGAAARLRAAGE